MMKHSCPRCGLESKRDGWWDRHPVLTVLLALPAGYTLIGVLLAYPGFFVPLLIVACTVVVDRRARRRHAIAARADYEHRALLARVFCRNQWRPGCQAFRGHSGKGHPSFQAQT